MNINVKLAGRYLRGRMGRTILTTASVVLGVMLLVCMGALVSPIANIVKKDIEASKVEIDIMVSREGGTFFPVDIVQQITQIPGAEETVGTIERTLRFPSTVSFTMPDGRHSSSLLVEIKAGDPAKGGEKWRDLVRSVGHTLAAGRDIDARDSGQHVAIISQVLAGAMGLGVGDDFSLPSAEGTIDLEIVGLVAGERATVGTEQVYTTLSAAQQIFNAPGQIDHILGLVPGSYDVPAVQEQVKAMLPPGYNFGSVSFGGGAWDTALQMAEIIFTAFGVLALIMAGLIMFNTFRIAIIQRRRDIGMLRAIGATRRGVTNTILVEALLQGVIGTIIGFILGYLLVWVMLPVITGIVELYFPGGNEVQPEFPLWTLIMAGVLGIGIPLLSGWWPARAAGRLAPMEALRPITQDEDSKHSTRRLIVAGILAIVGIVGLFTTWASGAVVLLFIGILLITPLLIKPLARALSGLLGLVFSSEGHMAERNLGRQPGRAAITVSTVAVGMAILVTLSSFITSALNGMLGFLDQTLSSDYMLLSENFISGGNDLGANPKFAIAVSQIDGVKQVATIRRSNATIDAEKKVTVNVMSVDPVDYPKVANLYFIEGERDEAFKKLGQGRTVFVNPMVAAQQQLKPGDTLNINTINGPQDFEVVAQAADFLNAESTAVYISQAVGEADFDLRNDALIMLNVDQDQDAIALENRILDVTRDYPSFDLTSSESLKNTQEENFQGIEIMYSILMIILAIPTLLALANTLTTNVLERVREIGVLRAIGSLRKQIRRMVVAEGLLLAIFGTTLGLIAGLSIGWFLMEAVAFVGLPLPYHFPFLGLWLAIGCGLVFGTLASLTPAKRAAKQNIIEALAYE